MQSKYSNIYHAVTESLTSLFPSLEGVEKILKVCL